MTELRSAERPEISQKRVTAAPTTSADMAPAPFARFQNRPASSTGVIVTPYIV